MKPETRRAKDVQIAVMRRVPVGGGFRVTLGTGKGPCIYQRVTEFRVCCVITGVGEALDVTDDSTTVLISRPWFVHDAILTPIDDLDARIMLARLGYRDKALAAPKEGS